MTQERWYDLFSRGARDWLRHNEKVRAAVHQRLPKIVADAPITPGADEQRVQVPVRLLEHYRFRLHETQEADGVGQGNGQPGDVYRTGRADGPGGGQEGGGMGGDLRFVLEFALDDIVDWLWQEMRLPHLTPKWAEAAQDQALTREGWDRRGPRARLDRRRTMREAVKRRTVQPDAPAFIDEDLRFRQLALRRQPALQAVVACVLDISGSMDTERRKLAKAFFFWATQGLRRQYGQLAMVFIAHTNEAWEFDESTFFEATATGGTVASAAFRLTHEVFTLRFPATQYNRYLFYASDGDNFPDDRAAAETALLGLLPETNFVGFVETPQNRFESGRSEMGRLFKSLRSRDLPVSSHTAHEAADVWEAIRAFFQRQAAAATA